MLIPAVGRWMPLCSMLVSWALAEVAPMVPAARTADAPATRARARFVLFIDLVGRVGLSINCTIIRILRIDHGSSER